MSSSTISTMDEDVMFTGNTPYDNNSCLIVELPDSLKHFATRILDLDQVSCISAYRETTSNIEWNRPFDSEEFTGIMFWELSDGKHSVWALHESLRCGPEFYINTQQVPINEQQNEIVVKLRKIVADHLSKHPQFSMNIDQFM